MATLETKSDADIDQWITNHERAGKTRAPLFQELIVERNRRHGRGLDITTSIAAMTKSARENRYISYGNLAASNGLTWTKARPLMNGSHGHLDDLLAYCHSHEMPLLTAIVVGKNHLDTGDMDEDTIEGFVAGIRRLGVSVADPVEFLKQCQSDCFEWAAKQPDVPDAATDAVEE
ncbi:hypothetical protein ACK6D9_04930 [Hoeflea sp. Naph1]|uniref:hypothetical protein n=1 Tax=Hoeflea sp. Naph1 TaxID=3388653 RepID=UPI00398FF502